VVRSLSAGLCALLIAACSGDEQAVGGATGTVGASALQTYCSGCHGVPQPGAHPPNEWPAVVARMQQRRAQKGLGAIPADARVEILRTLQVTGSGT